MTEDELFRRVGSALLQTFTEGFEPPEEESQLETITRLANVEIGHVRRTLRAMRLMVGADGWVGASTPQLEEIQAHLTQPVSRPKQSTNSFTTNIHGNNTQLQQGDEVSGSQTMNVIAIDQVFEGLKAAVEKVDASSEQKKSLLAQLNDVSKHPLFLKLVEMGIKLSGPFQ